MLSATELNNINNSSNKGDRMELKLEREILRLHPELSLSEVHEKALDIADYWIESCLPDVLEASE
jgi:hypothetical protein